MPGSSLGIGFEELFPESLTLEVVCNMLTFYSTTFASRPNSAAKDRRFSMRGPGSVILNDGEIEPTKLKRILNANGVCAVGTTGVNALFSAIAEVELPGKGQTGFAQSRAMQGLSFLKDQGHDVALSKSELVRTAGRHAVAAIITGLARVSNHNSAAISIASLLEKLPAIDFVPSDVDLTVQAELDMLKGPALQEWEALLASSGVTPGEHFGEITSAFLGD